MLPVHFGKITLRKTPVHILFRLLNSERRIPMIGKSQYPAPCALRPDGGAHAIGRFFLVGPFHDQPFSLMPTRFLQKGDRTKRPLRQGTTDHTDTTDRKRKVVGKVTDCSNLVSRFSYPCHPCDPWKMAPCARARAGCLTLTAIKCLVIVVPLPAEETLLCQIAAKSS